MRVLVVSSEAVLEINLCSALRGDGHAAVSAATGAEAIELAGPGDFDLAIVSGLLRDMAGQELLARLRRARVRVPALLLSVKACAAERVAAFASGADDVMSPPLVNAELLARARAIVRRSRGHATSKVVVGPLVIDMDSHTAAVDGVVVDLTRKEMSAVELMALRRGALVTREAFMNHLYGGMDEPEVKIVDVFLCKIRKKLTAAGAGGLIGTVWGRGYMLRAPVASSSGAAPTTAGVPAFGMDLLFGVVQTTGPDSLHL